MLELVDGTPYSSYALSGWLRTAAPFRRVLCNAVFAQQTAVDQCVPSL